jgi:uncharacterized membrane protein
MNHDQIQELLALSAAGLLDAAGERAIREHARECAACAAQLEALSAISTALSSRPAPAPPPDLMLRTQARVAAELAVLAERRRSVWTAAGAALLAWILNLATWAAIRWWRPELPGLFVWLVLSSLTACVAAPAAAVMAQRRRLGRSIQ